MRAPANLAAACLGLALCLATQGARGQDPLEAARKAFQEGDEAESRGDCALAIEKFSQAIAAKETAQLHLRIGRCQDKLGQLKAALASYDAGFALAQGDETLLELARKMRADLQQRIPRLTIRMPDAPPAAYVTLDGVQFRAFGLDTPLDPGVHVVEGEAPGRKPFKSEVSLRESERREITIDLPLRAETKGPEEPGPNPVPFVMFGVGAALLGASIGVAVRGVQLLEDADSAAEAGGCRVNDGAAADQAGAVRTCSGSPAVHAAYVDAVGEVNLHYGLAAGLGAAAGVSVAVGAILLGLDATAEEPAAAQALRVSPWAIPAGPAGASWGVVASGPLP